MLKRVFDIFFALLALVFLSPLMIVLSLMIALRLGRPVFFKQIRPGLHGQPFIIYKFRTMLDQKSEDGELLPDSQRLTDFGKVLRSTSLDELPELWNIFKGDMSFVGPRPLLVEYLPLYNEFQNRRHEVRPGLTGLSQIKIRNAGTWEDKFFFDVSYIDNQSFLLDLKIIMITVKKVIKREGITDSQGISAEKFRGNDRK